MCLCVAEQQATCVCLLPATETLIDRRIRDSHILGESFSIYDVTLSVVISCELAHIWKLLSDVSGKNHGSNWEGFDRSVVVESDSRVNLVLLSRFFFSDSAEPIIVLWGKQNCFNNNIRNNASEPLQQSA